MISFARVTAFLFMLLGVLLIVAGVAIAVRGPGVPPSAGAAPGVPPGLSILLAYTNTIAGALVGLQGLALAAVGQVLWFMASLAYQSQLTVEYLDEVVRRLRAPRPVV